ncbi:MULTISPECIES: cytochrome P450 [Pseudomonadota]|jgi:cytochrome P450|uniref:cytochrome P450 n=1 Tax=Pseudomonadota TaxID=1224 RepID=UPI00076A3EFE|nr:MULTISPECIES: cytochrome P450 [Pseudomonadota]|tara:strand:- start:45460 stop:46737 length:1278 start_codon:yes stop_codon:yes gene_type:complete
MNQMAPDAVIDDPVERSQMADAKACVFDVSEAELDAHPHEYIAEMRRHTEVWRRSVKAADREIGVYTVFSHDLCSKLLTHASTRQFYTQLLMWRGVPVGPLQNLFLNGMPTVDGPPHRRRRKPLAGSLTMPVIKSMQPQIRVFVRNYLKPYLAQGGMNVATDFAKTFPPRLLCSIIGIPKDEVDYFVGLARQAAVGLTLFPLEQLPDIDGAAQTLLEYVERLLEKQRTVGQSEFLGRYLESVEKIDPELTPAEVYVQLIDLMLASAETTRMTITNAVSLLLSHPSQWQALLADRSLVGGAVNEVLRYEPSVGTCPRFLVEDVELGDMVIPANSIISASLLGALRDPTLFSDPQRFNIMRTDFQRKHMVFGGGVHRCLGESLAWIEIFETIDAIADMIPNIRLNGDPVSCTGFSGIRRVTDCNVVY